MGAHCIWPDAKKRTYVDYADVSSAYGLGVRWHQVFLFDKTFIFVKSLSILARRLKSLKNDALAYTPYKESHSGNNQKMSNSKDPIAFSDIGLSDPILKVLDEIGYETPSPIQEACIPPILDGRDIIGQAQTGTGKTAAFALPLLDKIDVKQNAPQLLVLAPTRELAIQVAEAVQTYSRHSNGLMVLPIYGG